MKQDKSNCPDGKPAVPALAIAVMFAVVACVTAPLAAEENDVAQGQRIWADKAQCVECHGRAGDGNRSTLHSAGQAPSLRRTQLTRDQILHDHPVRAPRHADAALRSLRLHGQTMLRHDRRGSGRCGSRPQARSRCKHMRSMLSPTMSRRRSRAPVRLHAPSVWNFSNRPQAHAATRCPEMTRLLGGSFTINPGLAPA